MQTKNAIGNLVNRYKAVLKKCNILNSFGSLTLGVMLLSAPTSAAMAATDLTPTPSNGSNASFVFHSNSQLYPFTIPTQENADGFYTYGTYGIDLKNYAGHLVRADINQWVGAYYNSMSPIDVPIPVYTSISQTRSSLNDFEFKDAFDITYYAISNGTNIAGGYGSKITITDATNRINSNILGVESPTNGGGASVSGAVGVQLNGIAGNFIANSTTAGAGGGIYIDGNANIPYISGNFIANRANDGHGGGMYINAGATVQKIYGYNEHSPAVIAGNYTTLSGGGIFLEGQVGTLNAYFIQNKADRTNPGQGGGGLYISSSGKVDGHIDGAFINNIAEHSGGGLYLNLGSIVVGNINSDFIANEARTNADGYGGGGILIAGDSSVGGNITGDFIANKSGAHGGGMIISSTAPSPIGGYITGNFINNQAGTDNSGSGQGGGIFTSTALNFLADNKLNIFSGNTDSTGYNAITSAVNTIHEFKMMGDNGSFLINDSIRAADSIFKVGLNIEGEGLHNVFRLNNTVYDGSTIKVNNATLHLGTINQGGVQSSGIIRANQPIFTSGSMLTLEAPAYSETFAIQSSGASPVINVSAGAQIRVVGAPTGSEIKVAEGFDTFNIADGAWGYDSTATNNINPSTITSNSLLQSVQAVLDQSAGTFILKVVKATVANLDEEAEKVLEQYNGNPDPNSTDNGEKFLGRVVDTGYLGSDPDEVAKVMNGLLGFGNLALIDKTSYAAMQAGLNNVGDRQSIRRAGFNIPVVNLNQTVDAQSAQLDDSADIMGVSAGSDFGTQNSLTDGLALWVLPLYRGSSAYGLDGGNFSGGYNMDLFGISLGSDYTFNEMFRVGLAFNLGTGHTKSTGGFSETTNNSTLWGLNLYGGYYQQNFALYGDVSFTKVAGDIEQKIPTAMQMQTLTADVDSTAWSTGMTAEYVFNTSYVDIMPHVGVRYTYIHTSDYAIKSGGTVAEVESVSQGTWNFPVGVTFSKEYSFDNGWTFSPSVDLGFVVAAGDLYSNTITKIGTVTTDFDMKVVDEFAFSGGVSLNLANDKGLSMGLNYTLQNSSHETGHELSATLRYEF